MTPHQPTPKGSGIGFVLVQAILLGLLFFGPAHLNGNAVIKPQSIVFLWIGYAAFISGTVFAIIAALNLGRNFTPLPKPKNNAVLIQTGLYRWVRHPIYFGVILLTIGWGLIQQATLVWVYVIMIIIFFDIKSRKEEQWLLARFLDYAEYQKRVRKLIPWVY